MMFEWIATALPLADTEPSAISTFLSQVFLWGRVAVGIGLVIFVHELGHFVAAKTFGVKCEKFYVGFDVPIRIGPIKFPRTLGKFQYGETEYGIGILPLGGYVKMLGQDDDPRKAKEEADRIRLSGDETETDDEETPEQLDPRSYPAKPVWQRMIIISAGVIMNVLTGVLFAAIAFGYGVAYNPAIIGGVTPGGPAWQAGIQPGGQVVMVDNLKDEQLHFREMRLAILTAGIDDPNKPIDLSIQYDDQVRDYELLTSPHPLDEDMRMIGITSPTSTKLSSDVYAAPESAAAKVLTDADAGARVVAFDGIKINESSIVPGTPLFDYLNRNPDKTVELTLKRTDGQTHTIKLPPQKAKTAGFRVAVGPIVSLVTNGPAAKAGIKVGDVITGVGGEPVGDAFGLAIELTMLDGSVNLTLRRGEGDAVETIEVQLAPVVSPQTLSPTSGMGGEIAINSLGLAYRPLRSIAEITADSPAVEESGDSPRDPLSYLQVGDVLKEAHLVRNQDLTGQFDDGRFEGILSELEHWEFDDAASVTTFLDSIQFLPVGTEMIVFAERPPENKIVQTRLVVAEDDRFQFERGIGLTASESVQQATSFSQAMWLGYREGKRRLGDVFRFLGMLFRGRVKGKQVGGPIRIVQIAGMEAERGISPQLLFLTMLSMNLAILNFLPIPALDGGHMMFLIAEAIRGKRVDEQLEMRLTLAGVLALLGLMIFVFFNDIVNS